MKKRYKIRLIGLTLLAVVVALVVVFFQNADYADRAESYSAPQKHAVANDESNVHEAASANDERVTETAPSHTASYKLEPLNGAPPAVIAPSETVPWTVSGRGSQTRIVHRPNGGEVWRATSKQHVTGVDFNMMGTEALIRFAVAQENDKTAAVYRTSNFSEVLSLPSNFDHPRAMGIEWRWIANELLLGRCQIRRPNDELRQLTAAERESDAAIERTQLLIYDVERRMMTPLKITGSIPTRNVIELGSVRPDGYFQIWLGSGNKGEYRWFRID